MIISDKQLTGEYVNGKQTIIVTGFVDDISELPANTYYDRFLIYPPSEFVVIGENGHKYMIDEDGNWNLQAGSEDFNVSVTLDLSNYYTKAQADTVILNKINQNNANYYDKATIDTQVAALTGIVNTKMPLKFSDYTTIPDGANLGYGTTAGSYTTPGVYVRTTSSAGIAGRPSDYQAAFLLIVRNTSAESRYQQELYPLANVSGSVQHFFYKRYYTAAGWQDWTKFEGTATTPYVPTP